MLLNILMRIMGDELYMLRCIEIANKGLGTVAPNPLVGSVVVYNGVIIGEGYHKRYGEAHAEVNAIQSVTEKNLLPESTIYVNLEPCSHFGKTPPCADLIISSGIKKVVIGCVDPFAEVAGKGIARLRNHGCDVKVGVLKQKSLSLNKRFFTFHEKKRPYIILKWAQTADGFIDKVRNAMQGEKPMQISCAQSQQLLHKWRSEEAAIMIGTNTAMADNPRLNVRFWTGQQPVRIIPDRDLTLPAGLRVFDKTQPTILINSKKSIIEQNLNLVKLPFAAENVDIKSILEYLYNTGIQSVLVEGGQKLLYSFMQLGFWDEARVFVSPIVLGNGVRAPNIPANTCISASVGTDHLYLCKNPHNTYMQER